MRNILFIINTYRRSKKLLELLKQIEPYSQDNIIEILIYEDHSNEDYSACHKLLNKSKLSFQWFKTAQHCGKKEYWCIIDMAYRKAREIKFDYLFHLPDDITLTDNFINKAITTFNCIGDSRKICLNLLREVGRKNPGWTNQNEKPFGEVINTGWVDMCFVAPRRFLEVLDFAMLPVNPEWSNDPKRSSGVGMQISRRLINAGYSIYQVKKSLVNHGAHESVMHPEERKTNPLITNNMKITATMATMPARMKSLKQTVTSILPQVDELWIYLNDFETIPAFLRYSKIKLFESKKEVGDVGDAGKFYKCEEIEGYHFTIDDDLVYPPDYVKQMIAAIEKNNRKYIISCHGRVLGKMPIASYYHNYSEAVSCLREQPADKLVHIGGTGVMAYCTETLKVKFADFKAANMADIWMAVAAKKQGVKTLTIAHKRGWIKEGDYDRNYTIYEFCNRNDKYQTEVVNAESWAVL